MVFFIFEFFILPGIIALAIISQKKKQAAKDAEKRNFQGINRPQGTVPAKPAAPRQTAQTPPYRGSIQERGSFEGPRRDDRVHEAPTVTVGTSGHIARPATESDHVHTESSLTGFTQCPPQTSAAAKRTGTPAKVPPKAAPKTTLRAPDRGSLEPAAVTTVSAGAAPAFGALRFDAETARNAIIYAEVLGKPKALRR